MKNFSLLFILCLAVFAGCKKEKSETIEPDHISQEIWSIYDADNNDSYFGIRFYDVTWYKRVILTSTSTITLNGLTMTLNSVNSFYEVNYDNEQIPAGIFVYSDALKRVYTNTAEIEKSIGLPTIDTLYKTKDNVITWVGDPCSGVQETVTLHVGLILPLFAVTTTQAGATSVTVKSGALGPNAGSGWTRIRIDRETKSSLQQATPAGGTMYRKYKSKVKWVYVK
jgi:hypothetical protein